MKTLKFRAWDGERIKNVTTIGWIDGEIDYILTPKTSGPADDYTLMQFTGLHDKNGKDIYEGDVVTITGEDVKLVIEWAWNSYNFKGTADWDLTNHTPERELEVIGNIYENSDLVK